MHSARDIRSTLHLPCTLGAAFLLASAAALAADDEAPSGVPATAPTRLSGAVGDVHTVGAWAENDFQWSDKYYTNGLKFAYTSPEIFANGAPRFVQDLVALTPLAAPEATAPAAYRFHFSLAQEIYTAKDEYVLNPPLGDHPYSGQIYGTVGLSSETSNRLDVLELGLGVIGPSALGGDTQNRYHKLIDVKHIWGWWTQLHDEPIVQFMWTRIWRFNWLSDESSGLDFLPRLQLEAGTVRDYAAVGWQWRAGWRLPQDFGVSTIRATTGTTRPARDADLAAPLRWTPDSFYCFLDVQAEVWAWNARLDGNAWHDSRKVDSNAFVAQAALGFAAYWGRWRLSIAEVVRSREFRGQDREYFVFTSAALNLSF